jgi:type I restriction enzyme S subunit
MFDQIKLADLADLAMGETIIAEDCDGKGFPIYSASTDEAPWNHSSHISRRLTPGTIVVGARGSIGFPRMPTAEKFGATQTTITVTSREGAVHPRFLFHALRNLDFKALTSQQAIPMLTVADLGAVSLPRPPLDEQAEIVGALDTLDTTIRQTEAIIEKLKQVKQGLLHDLLTRGIDANGELRPPQSEAPHLYKTSPLGWIPHEWGAVPLSELADNLDGRRLPIKESERRQGMYPYYGASGIIDWVESYILDGDYVLLGEDGENVVSRNLPLAFRVTGKIWVNNHAHIYEAKLGVDIRFLVEVLEAKDYGPWVSGSAQPKLTQHALARIRFQRPPTHEQQSIADRLESLASRLSSERSELMKLHALKSGLMDDLLTGRVRVTPLLAQPAGT